MRIMAFLSPRYVWQQTGWPALTVQETALAEALHQARLEQGRLLGLLEAVGLSQALEVGRDIWECETLATAAIEGEQLDLAAVRSSVARRMGLSDLPTTDRNVDGLVDMMDDASRNFQMPLTEDRLRRWQAALFAGSTIDGFAGIRRIAVGRYRTHTDAMQIVSGLPGREVVHFQAPASGDVPAQMQAFFVWFESPKLSTKAIATKQPRMGGLVRAAVAHLWFETIHPFDDGNGRIGRAIADLALAQDAGAGVRVFGLSRQLQESRAAYYEALNAAQRGGLDITPWVLWFVQTFTAGCARSQQVVRAAMQKAAFWQRANEQGINPRQRKVLTRLLEAGDGGFLGGMTAQKYSQMTGASKPTATRDLSQLQGWGLMGVAGVGKATRYAVKVAGRNQSPESA